jgi:hypothetical protein
MIPTSVADEIIRAYGDARDNRRADPGRAACCDLLLEGVALLEDAAAELRRLEVAFAAARGGEALHHQGAQALEVMDRTGRQLDERRRSLGSALRSGVGQLERALGAPDLRAP